jgi:cell wall assembly regulator SMI1
LGHARAQRYHYGPLVSHQQEWDNLVDAMTDMVGPMPSDLEAIERSLTLLRRPVVQLLLPGQSAGVVVETLRAVGLETPAGLSALYAWHDGTANPPGVPADDLHVTPGFYFDSLGTAVTNLLSFRSDDRWPSTWLPVLANGGGDFMAVDCATAGGRVHHFRIDEVDQPMEFETTADWIATVRAAFEQGVYYVDERGYLEMNDSTFARLAADLNPLVPWWTE